MCLKAAHNGRFRLILVAHFKSRLFFKDTFVKQKIRRFMEIIFVMLAVIIKNTINTNIDFCLWNGIKI